VECDAFIAGEADPIIGEREENLINLLYALGYSLRLTSSNSTNLEQFLIAHMWWKA
jgi:hypothetical protein